MRSGTGTKSGPPSRVTRPTKSTIAPLAPPSFHDRKTSAVDVGDEGAVAATGGGGEDGPPQARATDAIAARSIRLTATSRSSDQEEKRYVTRGAACRGKSAGRPTPRR